MDRMKTFFKYVVWVMLFYFFSEFITVACLMSIKEADEPRTTEKEVKKDISCVWKNFSNPSIKELIDDINDDEK